MTCNCFALSFYGKGYQTCNCNFTKAVIFRELLLQAVKAQYQHGSRVIKSQVYLHIKQEGRSHHKWSPETHVKTHVNDRCELTN